MSSIDDRIASGNDESPSCQFIGGKNRRDYMQYNYPNDGGHCVDEMAFLLFMLMVFSVLQHPGRLMTSCA